MNFFVGMNNTTINNLAITEHGLSFWIDYNNKRYLFDTGQSNQFINNLESGGINIRSVDSIILSHNHYDHVGGVNTILDMDLEAEIFVGKGFWNQKKSVEEKVIIDKGASFSKDDIENSALKLVEVSNKIKYIDEGVFIVSQFERLSSIEKIEDRFVIEEDGMLIPDNFDDEIALCFEIDEGLVVFVGCSHPGIINIASAISKRVGKPIVALIGGFHLNNYDSKTCKKVALTLRDIVKKVITGHCTGNIAEEELKNVFKKDYYTLSAGENYCA